jgi:hypothetical protein
MNTLLRKKIMEGDTMKKWYETGLSDEKFETWDAALQFLIEKAKEEGTLDEQGNPVETSMEEFQKTWQGDLYAYLTDPDWLDPDWEIHECVEYDVVGGTVTVRGSGDDAEPEFELQLEDGSTLSGWIGVAHRDWWKLGKKKT